MARVWRLGPRRLLSVTRLAISVAVLERRLRREDITTIVRSMGISTTTADPLRSQSLIFTPEEQSGIRDVQRVLERGPFNNSCLRQSLLVGRVLSNRDVRLRLGVKKVDGQVKAHAWLLVDGHCVDGYTVSDGQADGFAVLPIDVSEIR